MSKTMQRTMAWLFAFVAALALVPGLAFADELTAQNLTIQEDDQSPWTEWADTDVIFKVKAEGVDRKLTTTEFTKAQMVELAAKNTEPAYYEFDKNGITVIAATEYVTIDQLLTAANATFESGDELIVSDEATGAKGAFTSKLSYDEYALAHYFYPARSSDDKTNAEGKTETPSIIALKWGFVENKGETAGSLTSQAAEKAYHGSLRNLWGATEDTFNSGTIAGKPYVTGAKSITIYKPFSIYTQDATGTKTLAKSYYRDDLAKMAQTDARGFLFNKNGWQVGATANYVDVATLLKDAFGDDFALAEGQSVVATASDGFSTYLPYAQFVPTKYFYPATTSSAISADGAEEVGTVLALTWETTQNEEVAKMDGTAGEAKVAITGADESKLVSQYRLFTGLLSADDSNTGGNRFATGPAEITIVTPKDVNDASIKVAGVSASYTYTGEAIQPEITVTDGDKTLSVATKKGGDYELAYGENTAIGEGSVTITGVNNYTGTRTITFKIASASADTPQADVVKKASQTISAKNIAKTFKGKKLIKKGKLAKKQTINVKSLAKASAKTTVTYKLGSVAKAAKKYVTFNAKTGKLTVKKGLKAGKYKVKVKLAAEANASYEAAKAKTITITIKVAKK